MDRFLTWFCRMSPPEALAFPLNLLPYTLRELICWNLGPEASLKLLQTTRELRHLVLHQGLSPRKIETLTISIVGVQMSDGVLFFDKLSIRLCAAKVTYEFQIRKHRPVWNEAGIVGITREDLRIFEKMRNVRKIDLELDGRFESNDRLPVDIAKWLPRFRFIGDFTIWASEITFWLPILADLALKFEQRFNLILGPNDRAPDPFGGPEICEFISSSLVECKVINLLRIGRIGRDPSVYTTLQKTNFSELWMAFARADDFWEAVYEFLEIGAPSRNREARIDIIRSRIDEETMNLSYPNEIDDFLKQYTIIVDRPEEKEPLLTKLSINLRDTRNIIMYRRILTENSQIFYIFRRCTREMKFCAKVEPILRAIS